MQGVNVASLYRKAEEIWGDESTAPAMDDPMPASKFDEPEDMYLEDASLNPDSAEAAGTTALKAPKNYNLRHSDGPLSSPPSSHWERHP